MFTTVARSAFFIFEILFSLFLHKLTLEDTFCFENNVKTFFKHKIKLKAN